MSLLPCFLFEHHIVSTYTPSPTLAIGRIAVDHYNDNINIIITMYLGQSFSCSELLRIHESSVHGLTREHEVDNDYETMLLKRAESSKVVV